MAWLWESDKEFKEYVQPVRQDHGNVVRRTHLETWFSAQTRLHEAATKLEAATRALRELHIDDPRPSEDEPPIERAEVLTEDIVYNGELLLLYHKRLAKSDAAYAFLHSHELTEHWERYATGKRIIHEINELIEGAENLLQGYRQLKTDDERFLSGLDLPEELLNEFALSRNLFSIGFDDIGVFVAGRALEGVLRAIARRRKLTYQVKGRDEALYDADLRDLIEAFARLKLANGTPVIDKETRSLLDYARTVRNATAHPSAKQLRRTARQIADVMANAAQHVWTTSNGTRLTKTPIIKNW